MKKLIFILIIGFFFLSCQKDEVIEPTKQLLTVEVYLTNLNINPVFCGFDIKGSGINLYESKTIDSEYDILIFKHQFSTEMYYKNKLNIENYNNLNLKIVAYTNPANKTYKIVDKCKYTLLVNNDRFINVIIE